MNNHSGRGSLAALWAAGQGRVRLLRNRLICKNPMKLIFPFTLSVYIHFLSPLLFYIQLQIFVIVYHTEIQINIILNNVSHLFLHTNVKLFCEMLLPGNRAPLLKITKAQRKRKIVHLNCAWMVQ